VLRGLSFTAEAGRVTALVGASGAGKSTVFHLLSGLADPEAGEIRIGGAEVRDLSLSDQRRLFAAVTQEPALFDETLRENLVLGREGLGGDRLAAAMDDAAVTEFVARLPEGLETPAGPRGSALSGGQRQRIAIARALLADAPVLLLDEATSALDAASETAVTAALARAQAGRTTLVIAHRLATVRDADHILVLDQGRVVEQGRHADLLAQGGLYARLHALQFRG
jgi:subfamily B ATP-binding cassette protein MsbA